MLPKDLFIDIAVMCLCVLSLSCAENDSCGKCCDRLLDCLSDKDGRKQ